MRILIAPDKFKGSLTAGEVVKIVHEVLSQEFPQVEWDLCPIADGGEGTAEALIAALQGQWVEVMTEDAHGRPKVASYGLVQTQRGLEAVMEMSAASGLAKVLDLPLDPTQASTFGTGVMLRDALSRGVCRILIGIGGSATNDAGTGMARALGYQFLDAEGRALPVLPRDLDQLCHIVQPQLSLPPIQAACDVENPLLGPNGCTQVYGPQKGVTCMEFFEYRLEKLSRCVRNDLGCDFSEQPGSGAAGGLGYGLMTFAKAELVGGFDLISDLLDLPARVQQADLIITGEGRLDEQTLHGKGPMGLARLAKAARKPVFALAGAVRHRDLLQEYFQHFTAITPDGMPMNEAIQRAPELLAEAARELVPAIRHGLRLA